MSETKLCPFLCAAVYLANLDGPAGTYKACLQEKCAMWVKESGDLGKYVNDRLRSQGSGIQWRETGEGFVPAHCGLAGRP